MLFMHKINANFQRNALTCTKLTRFVLFFGKEIQKLFVCLIVDNYFLLMRQNNFYFFLFRNKQRGNHLSRGGEVKFWSKSWWSKLRIHEMKGRTILPLLVEYSCVKTRIFENRVNFRPVLILWRYTLANLFLTTLVWERSWFTN